MRVVHRGTCGHTVSDATVKVCRPCWKKEQAKLGTEPRRYTATLCGHPVTSKRWKYCRTCYDLRRSDIIDQGTQAPATAASLKVTGDKAEVGRVTNENIRTLADLVRVCEIDTVEWVVERWIANKWEMGAKDAAGDVTTTPLFQVKAWLVRNRQVLDARTEVQSIFADARAAMKPRKQVKVRKTGPHMLEIAIPDLHLGKLAWSPETGWPNYDSKIAADLFEEALEALLDRTRAFSFERIVLPVGHDFFHSDSKTGTTTAGTPLDNDSRFHKTFVAGRQLLTRAIDRLREFGAVSVVVVPGNHDTMASFHVGDSLSCLYSRTKGVEIMNDPVPRKYISYGKNLILYTHGDKGRRANLPLLMATERPELFGAARFREAHVGHTHETKVEERMGVRVRVSPALCSPDAWHSDHLFVGNVRGAEAFVWSKEDGIVAMAIHSVKESR